MMARSPTLQPKAGYIDARPPTANSTKFSCNARPDHTFGSDSVFGQCPLHVRFPPDRDQIADVATLRLRAISNSASPPIGGVHIYILASMPLDRLHAECAARCASS